jgi:hypothetical protein
MVLSALYGSPLREYSDAENILIYNVGASHMAAVAALGIRIERVYYCPTPPAPLESDAQHYWRYRAVPSGEDFSGWTEGTTFATWSDVPMPPLTETTKPVAVWHALRTARIEVLATAHPNCPFGLRLDLALAPGEHITPAKAVKPLVDGVIAALHCHDGSALADVSQRLNNQLSSESRGGLEALLVDDRFAPLGRRRLLWPRASSVQWNPADDSCVALELRLGSSSRRELSGRLISVEEK